MRRALPLVTLVGLGIVATTLGCSPAKAGQAHSTAPSITTPTVARTDRLSVELMVDLSEVGEVAIAPNGKSVAYVVRVPAKPDDGIASGHDEIWIAPIKGGTPRRFTTPGVNSRAPRWSPDGKSLAFLSERKGTSHRQVWIAPIDGGEARAVTSAASNVSKFEWSPKGDRIAYTTARPKTREERKDAEAGRDWITTDIRGTWQQLWIAPLGGGEAKAITPRDRHVVAFRWSPDGKRLALQAADRPDVDAEMMYSRLYTIAAEGGALKPLTQTAGKLGELAWSPDGSQIAYLGAEDIHDPTAGILWIVPASGGPARALTAAYEGTGIHVHWIGKDAILLLAHQGTSAPLLRVSLKGESKPIGGLDAICRQVDLGRDGQTIACAAERPDHPRELYVGDVRRGLTSRLTRLNPQLDAVQLGERKIVRWTAADGLALEGVLTLPVDYKAGERYPLAILPHGGPEGISLNGWNSRAGYPVQMFATRGYVVFEPNYRGSSGRGVAFGKADHGDLGGKEFEDVIAGIDHLAKEGLVDPNRVGIGGWSYGGYFSGLAATKHSDRFRAAMVGAAITNWVSFTGTTEIEHENSLVHWKLWPYDDYALAWERSPMAHVSKAKTPTLIVHGESDTRVPPEQATELYRALRHKKVETEIVYYPREGHGLRERAHQIDFANRFLDWFDGHLAPRSR